MMAESATRDRMIAAAAREFARAGFNGITTKDIAQSANVSEGNIFRYFTSKRDLFIAAIDYELGRLSVRAEVIARIANAEDTHTAFRRLFELITETVVSQPDLIRLLNFSLLEFGNEMEPIYRRHLDAVVMASAHIFEKWSQEHGLERVSPRVTVLSFVATVILLQNYPVLTGLDLPFSSIESAASEYAELWHRALCGKSELPAPTPSLTEL